MSTVLDGYVNDMAQFAAIGRAARAWMQRNVDAGEHKAAVRLSEKARDAMTDAALAYVGANEGIRELAGETRGNLVSKIAGYERGPITRVHRCRGCGRSPAEADHGGAWTFPFSKTCPSCSASVAPPKRRRH